MSSSEQEIHILYIGNKILEIVSSKKDLAQWDDEAKEVRVERKIIFQNSCKQTFVAKRKLIFIIEIN